MENVFITQHFDWDRSESRAVRRVNALLRWLGYGPRLSSPFRGGDMTNVEQRINMFHLVEQVLVYRVPGDLVELGTHSGTSAALIQTVIRHADPSRRLHVYDMFEDTKPDQVSKNFAALGLPPPEIHAGLLEQTLPGELPGRIAFAHVDLGPGLGGELLLGTVRHALEAIYPRMSPGSVGLLADYCDPGVYEGPGRHFPHAIASTERWHLYPQVKHAADAFFADKPERVDALYSGGYSHGYFRKR